MLHLSNYIDLNKKLLLCELTSVIYKFVLTTAAVESSSSGIPMSQEIHTFLRIWQPHADEDLSSASRCGQGKGSCWLEGWTKNQRTAFELVGTIHGIAIPALANALQQQAQQLEHRFAEPTHERQNNWFVSPLTPLPKS